MGKIFIFDAARCTGCHNCQLACKDEHVDNDWSPIAKPQPDTGQFWTRVEQTIRGQVPKVKISYVVHMCQHCDNAPCLAAAPNAIYRRDDGLVIIDPSKANGLKSLVEACPYGAIFYNPELQIPQKCTGCAHLVDEGLPPHCVDVCPHQALRFGEESEFATEIAKAEMLMPERAGDKPRVKYLNLPKRFLAGIVVDLEEQEVIIGAKVTIQNAQTEEVLVTTTDEFGDFWFHQIDAADYNLFVEAEGYMTRTFAASTVEEDRNTGPIAVYAA
jgi:Fe-S-cluster-containing dehydrogenase component